MNRIASQFALSLALGFVFISSAQAANPTEWNVLKDRFVSATPVSFDEVRGIHAGRCFKYSSPDLPRDSVLAVEIVPGSEASGPLFPKPGAKAGEIFSPPQLFDGAKDGLATGTFDELTPWIEQAIGRYLSNVVEYHRQTIAPTETPQGLKIEYYYDSGSQAVVSERQILVKRDREYIYVSEFYIPNSNYKGDVPWTGLPKYCYYFKKLK